MLSETEWISPGVPYLSVLLLTNVIKVKSFCNTNMRNEIKFFSCLIIYMILNIGFSADIMPGVVYLLNCLGIGFGWVE